MRPGIIQLILILAACLMSSCVNSELQIDKTFKTQEKPLSQGDLANAKRIITVTKMNNVPVVMDVGKSKLAEAAGILGPGPGLVGMAINTKLDKSGGFGGDVIKHLDQIKYSKMISARMEKTLKSRYKGEIISLIGEVRSQYKPVSLTHDDKVITINNVIFFMGNKPKMQIMFEWTIVLDGIRYKMVKESDQIRRNEILERKIKAYKVDWNQVMNEYDGYGTISYLSPPHSPDEWLADDGRLLKVEFENGLNDFSNQIGLWLFR